MQSPVHFRTSVRSFYPEDRSFYPDLCWTVPGVCHSGDLAHHGDMFLSVWVPSADRWSLVLLKSLQMSAGPPLSTSIPSPCHTLLSSSHHGHVLSTSPLPPRGTSLLLCSFVLFASGCLSSRPHTCCPAVLVGSALHFLVLLPPSSSLAYSSRGATQLLGNGRSWAQNSAAVCEVEWGTLL